MQRKVSRIDVIGQNGNDGLNYKEIELEVYANDHYVVIANRGAAIPEDNYHVVNKSNGIVEARSDHLPQALAHAEEYNVFLKNDLHKRIKVSIETQIAMEDKFNDRETGAH